MWWTTLLELPNLIGLAGLLIAVVHFVLQVLDQTAAPRRELSFEVLKGDYVPVHFEGTELNLNGKRLANPHVCEIRVKNSGRDPIPANQFERGIAITIPECSSHGTGRIVPIAAQEIIRVQPKGLEPEVTVDTNGVLHVEPLLLNQGDGFTIGCLLPNCFERDEVSVVARVQGVRTVVKQGDIPFPWLSVIIGMISVIVGSFVLWNGLSIIGYAWAVMGALAAAVALTKNYYRRKIRWMNMGLRTEKFGWFRSINSHK